MVPRRHRTRRRWSIFFWHFAGFWLSRRRRRTPTPRPLTMGQTFERSYLHRDLCGILINKRLNSRSQSFAFAWGRVWAVAGKWISWMDDRLQIRWNCANFFCYEIPHYSCNLRRSSCQAERYSGADLWYLCDLKCAMYIWTFEWNMI